MTMKDVGFSFVVKEIFKVKHKKCRCSLRVAAFLILYLSVPSLHFLFYTFPFLLCIFLLPKIAMSRVFVLQFHHQRQRLSVGADVPTAALACDLVAEPVGCLCAQ